MQSSGDELSGGYDESLRMWDMTSGHQIRAIPAHSDPVSAVDWHKKDTEFASSSFDGVFRQWDAGSGKCLATRNILTDYDPPPLTHLEYTRNGKYLLVAPLDSKLTLWDVKHTGTAEDTRPVKTYPREGGEQSNVHQGHTNVVYQMRPCFAMSELVIMGCEATCRIFVYQLNTQRVIEVLPSVKSGGQEGHSDIPMAVDAHKSMLASVGGASDAQLLLWRASAAVAS